MSTKADPRKEAKVARDEKDGKPKAHITEAQVNTIGQGPVFSEVNASNQNYPDHFRVFEKLLTPEQCRRVIEQMEKVPFKASVVGTDEKATKAAEIRRSKIKWVPMTMEFAWIYKIIEKAISQANHELWWFFLDGWREHIQLSMYDEGEKGHYEWHMDCGAGYGSGRKVSMSVQLSAPKDYEGGEMQFLITQKPVTVSKEQGLGVVFPSYMEHRVRPVTKGKRYSLVIWVTGPVMQ